MALSGIRVVDLTRILSGPFCSMLLGDMGAEIIKVEPPERGDPVRGQGTIRDGMSWYFAAFNRNKRSLTLDLYTEPGRAVLAQLIGTADVLVENFRPGVLDRIGFGPDRLKELNPGLVSCNINGFGSAGPYVDRPAFDFIAQAMSGFMSVNGRTGQEPMRAAPPISDLVAGLYAAFGVVCALVARGRTGGGQQVETAMTNGLISMMAYLSAEYFATGRIPERTGNDHPLVAPYGLYRAMDGDIAIALSTEVVLRRFLDVVGLPRLTQDPRFDSNDKRMARRDELTAIINERLSGKPGATWIEQLNAAGVPCGRVMDLAEVFDDPQVLAQEMVIDVEQPDRGAVRMTGFPVKLSDTPCRLHRPVPELGQDTDAILGELGYDGTRIDRLRADGII